MQQKPIAKDQTATFSHWFLLILFSLVTVATFTQQLLFLLFVFVIAALVKGPEVILWGVVYSFLVTLFPPSWFVAFNAFLSAHSQAVDKKLTFIFTAVYFYSYPFLITAIHHFTTFDDQWIMIAAVIFALISGHLFV